MTLGLRTSYRLPFLMLSREQGISTSSGLVVLVVFGLLVGTGPVDAQSVASDSVRTDAYALFASSTAALQEATPQLDAAARRFEDAFGVAPSRISVLLADDPETLRTADLDPYRAQGVAFLPYLTSQGLQAASADPSASNAYLLDGGALVTGGEERVQVAKVVSLPSASTPLQTGDKIEALQDRPVRSVADLRRRYQDLAVGDSVRLRVRREGREETVALTYQKTEQSAQVRRLPGTPGGRASGQGREMSPQSLLHRSVAHEACHAYAEAHAEQWLQSHESTAVPETEEYGHPQLPDWVDEAAATLCEDPSQQERRLRHLRQNFGQRIPIAELLTMRHPLAGIRVAAGDSASAGEGKGANVGMLRMRADSDVIQRAILFYGQTLSLSRYLRERVGADGFRRIVNMLLSGASAAEAFREVDGLPDTVDALEEAWKQWVRK